MKYHDHVIIELKVFIDVTVTYLLQSIDISALYAELLKTLIVHIL